MGRRSDHTREEVRAMALEAAGDLAADGGIGAVSARAVAGRIGYAVGTLYNIFGNLDGLLTALNDRSLAMLEDALDAAAPLTGDPAADLDAMLAVYADQIAAAPKRWALLNDHTLPDGEAPPDWYSARVERLLARIEAALAPLTARKADPAGEAARAARILWLAVHGILGGAAAGTVATISSEDARALTRTLVATYLRGLAAEA